MSQPRRERGVGTLEMAAAVLILLPLLLSALTFGVIYRKQMALQHLAEDFSSRLQLRTKKLISGNQGFFVYDQFQKTGRQQYGDAASNLLPGEGRLAFTRELRGAANELNTRVREILGCSTAIDCSGAYAVEIRYLSVNISREGGFPAEVHAGPGATLYSSTNFSEGERYFETRGFPTQFPSYSGSDGSPVSYLRHQLEQYVEGFRENKKGVFPYAVPTGLYRVASQRNYGFSELAVDTLGMNGLRRRAPQFARAAAVAGISIQVDLKKLLQRHPVYEKVFLDIFKAGQDKPFQTFMLIPPRQNF